MRGMRPAKNPNAKNKFVQRRLRRDDDDEEEDEDAVDQQALEDCDGTETGAFAQFCQTEGQARVSSSVIFRVKVIVKFFFLISHLTKHCFARTAIEFNAF